VSSPSSSASKATSNASAAALDLVRHEKVLVVGCGNSLMSEQVSCEGFSAVISIDYISSIVDELAIKYRHRFPSMQFVCMDATKLSFSGESFELVLDKGTLDAILCGAQQPVIHAMIEQIYRVLKCNGVYAVVSCNPPAKIASYVMSGDRRWLLQFRGVGQRHSYLYLLKRLPDGP